jgi:hypothetical protein
VADPLSLRIVQAIVERLETISTEDGYRTDAGENVHAGLRFLDRGEQIVLCVTAQNAQAEINTFPRVTERMAVNVEGHRVHDGSNAERLAHELIADIKQAVMRADDRTLGGLCRTLDPIGWGILYPEDGEQYVSVQAGFSIRYHERYGRPDVAA